MHFIVFLQKFFLLCSLFILCVYFFRIYIFFLSTRQADYPPQIFPSNEIHILYNSPPEKILLPCGLLYYIHALYLHFGQASELSAPQAMLFNGINLSLLDVSMTGVLSNMNKQRPCYGAGEPCLALCA